jgi:hypothetical protein
MPSESWPIDTPVAAMLDHVRGRAAGRRRRRRTRQAALALGTVFVVLFAATTMGGGLGDSRLRTMPADQGGAPEGASGEGASASSGTAEARSTGGRARTGKQRPAGAAVGDAGPVGSGEPGASAPTATVPTMPPPPNPTATSAPPPTPAGNRAVVFTRGYRLWVTHADGTDTSPLTADDWSHRFADADWSPDGNHLAAVEWHSDATGKATGRISIVDLEGNARPVTPYVAEHGNPDWSPDGRRIAYLKARERVGWSVPETDIWVVNADGTGNRRLTTLDGYRARWLPNGRVLGTCGGEGGLCSVDPDDESDVHRIASGLDVFDFAVSPDGRRLAAHVYDEGDHYVGVMDVDGSDRTRLLHRWYAVGIDWSPDGRSLVFSGLPDSEPPSDTCLMTGSVNDSCPESEGARIWRMAADGSDLRPLTSGPGDYEPTWRPND